jgi:hypothetical protein
MSSTERPAPKYVIVEDYGDSLVEKINSVFEEVVTKVGAERFVAVGGAS